MRTDSTFRHYASSCTLFPWIKMMSDNMIEHTPHAIQLYYVECRSVATPDSIKTTILANDTAFVPTFRQWRELAKCGRNSVTDMLWAWEIVAGYVVCFVFTETLQQSLLSSRDYDIGLCAYTSLLDVTVKKRHITYRFHRQEQYVIQWNLSLIRSRGHTWDWAKVTLMERWPYYREGAKLHFGIQFWDLERVTLIVRWPY